MLPMTALAGHPHLLRGEPGSADRSVVHRPNPAAGPAGQHLDPVPGVGEPQLALRRQHPGRLGDQRDAPASPGPLNILVTLGTIAPYRFDRAVDAVLSLIREGDEVTWQLGRHASARRSARPGLRPGRTPRAGVVVPGRRRGRRPRRGRLDPATSSSWVTRPCWRSVATPSASTSTTIRLGIASTMARRRSDHASWIWTNPCRRILETAAGRTVTQRHHRLGADRVA